jgi:hypothetical protein
MCERFADLNKLLKEVSPNAKLGSKDSKISIFNTTALV